MKLSRFACICCLHLQLLLAPLSLAHAKIDLFDQKPKLVVSFHGQSWKLKYSPSFMTEEQKAKFFFYEESFGSALKNDTALSSDATNAYKKPIDKITKLFTGGPTADYEREFHRWLVAQNITLANCQDAMTWVLVIPFSFRAAPEDSADAKTIEYEIARIKTAHSLLMKQGWDEVFFTTTHRTYGRSKSQPGRWSIKDTLIMHAYNHGEGSHRFIDMHSPSRKMWPYHVVSDFEHPVSWLSYAYSRAYCRAFNLYAERGDSLSAFDTYLQGKVAANKAVHDKIAIKVLAPTGDAMRIGDRISIEVDNTSGIPCEICLAAIWSNRLFRWKVGDAGTGKHAYSFTVPETGTLSIYSYLATTTMTGRVYGDSAFILVHGGNRDDATSEVFNMTRSYRLLNKDGSQALPPIAVGSSAIHEYSAGPDTRFRLVANYRVPPVYLLNGRLAGLTCKIASRQPAKFNPFKMITEKRMGMPQVQHGGTPGD